MLKYARNSGKTGNGRNNRYSRATAPAASPRFNRSLPPDWHTTIIDRRPPRRASWLLMAAMFTGGAFGLVTAQLRGSSEETPSAYASAALEVAAPLSPTSALDGAVARELPRVLPRVGPRGLEVGSPLSASVIPPIAPIAAAPVAAPAPRTDVTTDRVRDGESLSVALQRHGVGAEDVGHLVVALKKAGLTLRNIRADDVYRVEQSRDQASVEPLAQKPVGRKLASFEFQPRRHNGAPVTWRAQRGEAGFSVERQETPLDTKIAVIGGEVTSNLYLAMKAIGEGSLLVSRFADVFAWDIDFYRQTQKGDTFKAVVEKNYADGEFVGYGRVLAAEYDNAGRVRRGFVFASADGEQVGIFDENGNAREKTFLKNPLEIARITSSYGQRFHPILKRKRAHHGVDYGASKGTAFWSVADGVVKEARYSRTAGNMVVIQHIKGYETQYFHATGFAPGIRPGARVKQRQVLGYVGNTGRSTAPHLHFGMKKRGGYVDPGKQKFPAATPVPNRYKAEFDLAVRPLLAEMEALEVS